MPPPIQGVLPWAGGDAGAAFRGAASGDLDAVAGSYQQAYNNALAMNSANYNNILAGYQQTLAGQSTAQAAIGAGYTDLYNSVLAKVEGIGQARANAINRDSDRFLARQSQQLIDRGLGNTTVQASVGRGVEADRNARQLELSESTAGMIGSYMSQLGLAGLSNRQRGLENETALSARQLDWMNSVDAQYPDAGMYASLAQMAGENRAADDFGGGAFAGGGRMGGGPAPKVGYVPDRYSGPEYGGVAANVGASGGIGGGLGTLGGNWDDGIPYMSQSAYAMQPAQDFGPFQGSYYDQPGGAGFGEASPYESLGGVGKGYTNSGMATVATDPYGYEEYGQYL